MRILILDHNLTPSDWGARDLRQSVARAAAEFGAATLVTRRPPGGDLPAPEALEGADAFHAIVLSGSLQSCIEMPAWARALDRFLSRAIGLRIPLLGVCYGHQAIARVIGGPSAVGRSQTPEYGPTKLTLVDPGRLLAGIGDIHSTFYSASSHAEEVRPDFIAKLSGRAKVLARSKHCAVQAFELVDAPVFGIQFHPEKDREAFGRIKGKRVRGNEHYDANVGETIFKNFLRLAHDLRAT